MVTEVTAANVEGPPPFRAQKRSGYLFGLTSVCSPEAVITSNAKTLSDAIVKCGIKVQ